MTDTAIMPFVPISSSRQMSIAVSEEAESIVNLYNDTTRHLDANITVESRFNEAFRSLLNLAVECGDDDWDGYGAKPVNAASMYLAVLLLQRLPSWADQPELSCDPDGDVSIEWYHGPRKTFSISVGEDGTLHYSGLFGTGEAHGSECFADDLPPAIVDNIYRLQV